MLRHTILALSALCALAAQADVLSPEQALQRALGDAPARMAAKSRDAYRLVRTDAADGLPAVYVFNDAADGDFFVLSADDAADAILGYGDNMRPEADMPPAFLYWIGEYSRQIALMRAEGEAGSYAASVSAAAAERHNIAPMVATRWNQGEPFNGDCPSDNNGRSVTGCVATAMAQIMKHYDWPATGTGSHSYTWNGQTLSLDFSSVNFAWPDMLDRYDASATAAQKAAVAQLMYACGVAVDMNYSSGESGAQQNKIASALTDYFGYDKAAVYVKRDWYTLAEWSDLIYGQLAESMPVALAGRNSGGGHSFVCDGYRAGDYFHINWGWGGTSDGYFKLSALDPDTQGIGGSAAGYNQDQDAVINIRKPVAGSGYSYVMALGSALQATPESVSLGSRVTITTSVYNYSPRPFSGTLGYRLESLDGAQTREGACQSFENLKVNSGYRNFGFVLPADLAEGSWKLSIVFKPAGGEWTPVSCPASARSYALLTVAAGKATVQNPTEAMPTVESFEPVTPLYLNKVFGVKATLRNDGDGEYYGSIGVAFFNASDNSQVGGGTSRYPVTLAAGETRDIEFTTSLGKLSGKEFTAGQYLMALYDAESGRVISSMLPVQVQEVSGSTALSVTNLAVVGDAQNVNNFHIRFRADVSCTQGYYTGNLNLYFFPLSGGSSSDYISSNALILPAGQSATAEFYGSCTNLQVGQDYRAYVFAGSTQMTNGVQFHVGSSTGIADVEADSEIVATEIYTAAGLRVDPADSLAPGVYIVREIHGDGTVSVRKQMKR